MSAVVLKEWGGAKSLELARKVPLHLATNAPTWKAASREVVMLTAVTDICLTSLANVPQLARNMATAAQTNTLATVPYTK